MRFPFIRVGLFSLAGMLAGWLTGRALSSASAPEALSQKLEPMERNQLPPNAAPPPAKDSPAPPELPESHAALAAELDGEWFAGEQWKASRLQQLERCSTDQLASVANGLMGRKDGSPASRALATLALLLLAERNANRAVDIACASTPSSPTSSNVAGPALMRSLAENLGSRLGADGEAQLRTWLGKKHNVLSGALISQLAKSDPEKALAFWTELQPANNKESGTWNIIAQFVSALSSAGRIDLALQLGDASGNPVLKKTAVALACSSVTNAQLPELQARLAAGEYSDQIWSAFSGRLAGADPEAARAWAENLTDAKRAQASWEAIGKSVAITQPHLIKSWLASIPEGPARSALLSGALWEMQTSEVKAILAAEKSLPSKMGGLGMVASDLHRGDPAAADAWAASLPEGPGKQHVLNRFKQDRTVDDPRGFLDDLAKQPDSEERQMWIRQASAGYAESRSEEWLAWCQSLAPEDGADLLQENWGRLAANAPAAAARFAAGHSDFEGKLDPALRDWAKVDLDAAAGWSASLPRGSARSTALHAITEYWTSVNPADCRQWRDSVKD